MNDETISKLQKLIQANIDASNGFSESAREIDNEPLAELFRVLSDDRSAMANELQNYVELNSEEAEDDGSFAAKVHRAWIDVRAKLNGGDPYVILIEAERGEDHIKAAYEEVLKETAGSAMNDVLTAQYARVKAGHDKVRDLRDAYKNES